MESGGGGKCGIGETTGNPPTPQRLQSIAVECGRLQSGKGNGLLGQLVDELLAFRDGGVHLNPEVAKLVKNAIVKEYTNEREGIVE